MKYLRRYVDEEKWEEINRKEMEEKIGLFYSNPDAIVSYLEQGRLKQIRTPWAFFEVHREDINLNKGEQTWKSN